MPITLLLVSCASFLHEMNQNLQTLGNTGIQVSGLCFGSLTMTPMQKNLSVKEGAALLTEAFSMGINFVDTAQYYENYAYLKEAVDQVLNELNTDYIDLFMLHEQESEHTLRGHQEALAYFCECKEKGIIRATGLSTHRLAGVAAAIEHPDIEVIHPIVNQKGIGIQDGTMDEMEALLVKAKAAGKGIYAMKPLGGGHLIKDYAQSLTFALLRPYVDSVAIGMQSKEEIRCNVALLDGRREPELEARLQKKRRTLSVADYCSACGACVKRCRQDGIRIVNGRATPNENCILCGYCAKACPDFCIKVI